MPVLPFRPLAPHVERLLIVDLTLTLRAMQHRLVVQAVAATVLLSAAAQARAQSPVRWGASGSAVYDFTFGRDSTVRHGGTASIRISAASEPNGFAGIGATIPAAGFTNRTLRLTAHLRSEDLGVAGGAIWLRADRNNKSLAFATSGVSPIRGTSDWRQVTITLAVPDSAQKLYFGALSADRGTLWIDDVRLEAMPQPGATDAASVPAPLEWGATHGWEIWLPPPADRPVVAAQERSRALSARGLDNVTAFAEAAGYVRFFHPAEQAVSVNWDQFTIRGMRAVEQAPNADSLARTLSALFAPVAPTVAFASSPTALPPTSARDSAARGVIYWRHIGIGTPSGAPTPARQNVYSSTRVWARLSTIGSPIQLPAGLPAKGAERLTVPDPSHPMTVDVGAGVSMRLPLAVYSSDTAVSGTMTTYHPAADYATASAHERATRFASVALVWSVMEHFYPYFDIAHVDWHGELRRELAQAATDSTFAAFEATMQRLVASLHDGHGGAYRMGSARGMPDITLASVEGRVIVSTAGDSARAQGVRVGDELLTIDGRGVPALMKELLPRISGATDQWVQYRLLSELMLGPPGTVATVTIRDPLAPKAAQRTAQLTRGAVPVTANNKLEKIAELAPGIFYVDIERITNEDFTTALPRLASARGVVFDMRGYPRQVSTPLIFAHLTDTLIHSAHFESPIFVQPVQPAQAFIDGRWDITPVSPRISGHVVFLTGAGAVSYAESTMGIVEAYHMGDIVGETTAGTNGNVNAFQVPGGYTIAWTGMRVTKHDGTPHHGVGIAATVPVKPTLKGIRDGKDEVLERGVQIAGRGIIP